MLTIEELTELEIVLDLNIKEAISKGYKIKPHNVIDHFEKICCLVGSVLINKNMIYNTTLEAIKFLDLSHFDGNCLVHGFDNYRANTHRKYSGKLCAMGVKFREKIMNGEYGDMT